MFQPDELKLSRSCPTCSACRYAANQNHHTSSPSEQQSWLTDSGANSHITSDINQLSTAHSYEGEDHLTVGSGQNISITHSCCGILPTPHSSFKLLKLLCVPKISSNLLSVHKLCLDNNCSITFDSNSFFIQDNLTGRILFQGPCVDGLYPITPSGIFSKRPPGVTTPIAQVVTTSSSYLWHSRLGHPSNPILSYVLKILHLPTCKLSSHSCYPCLQGKLHKIPFPISTTVSLHPLELIHVDVWGPSPFKSISGRTKA